MQLSWFRQPTGDDAGTANLSYVALDLPIIRGHATDPAIRREGESTDFATLLEQTAALGGAMRGVGVRPGDRVAVLLDDPVDQLVALLATLRVGAVHVTLSEPGPVATIDAHEPSLLLTSRVLDCAAHTPPTVFLRALPPRDEQRELDWDLALKAGRTDPAGAEPVAGDSLAYVHARAVRVCDVVEDSSAESLRLATLASGGCLEMKTTSDNH